MFCTLVIYSALVVGWRISNTATTPSRNRCKQFKRPSADTLFRLQANAKNLRLLFAMLFLSA